MKGFLLVLLRFYRACISPLKRPTCRFIPTCSEYAMQAVEQYGPYIGLWMSMKRLARCHPFNPGGFDPVDDRKKEARS